jgi:Cdc6-like AAA superfamily ATPase
MKKVKVKAENEQDLKKQEESDFYGFLLMYTLLKNNKAMKLSEIKDFLETSIGSKMHESLRKTSEVNGRQEQIWYRNFQLKNSTHWPEPQNEYLRKFIIREGTPGSMVYKLTESAKYFCFDFLSKFDNILSAPTSETSSKKEEKHEKYSGALGQFIIYYGPPGTGKTNKAKELHIAQFKEKKNSNSYIVQIHPSFGYEDLVEGLKPVTYFNGDIKYQIVDGPVKIMARKATADKPLSLLCCVKGDVIHLPIGAKTRYGLETVKVSMDSIIATDSVKLDNDYFDLKLTNSILINAEDRKSEKGVYVTLYFWDTSWNKDEQYVLLLDEINRGHVATILGELVFAISETTSDDKEPVKLQYSGESFLWPENLSLIGTMNTADTTTDRIDQAIKRRFKFEPVNPLQTDVEWAQHIHFSPFSSGVELVAKLQEHLGSDKENPLLPWVALKNINNCLYNTKKVEESVKDARDFNAIAVKEKRIGHSYFIKYAREFLNTVADNPLKDKKILAQYILGEILENEVYPSMINIFNNNEENFQNFKDEVLCGKNIKDKIKLDECKKTFADTNNVTSMETYKKERQVKQAKEVENSRKNTKAS